MRRVNGYGTAALALALALGLGGVSRAGHHGTGYVTVGGPAAVIPSPAQTFYGGYGALMRPVAQRPVQPVMQPVAARPAARVDSAATRTVYQEPATNLEPLEQPEPTLPAGAARTPATANTTAPAVRTEPAGAINYNDGYGAVSPATILAPAVHGKTSGWGRAWIRWYYPQQPMYGYGPGYGYGYGPGYGYGY